MIAPNNDAPRPDTGACAIEPLHPNHSRCSPMELVADIAPRPELTVDYVVLATLLHRPDLAADFVSRLHPADWETDMHRVMARIALAHLRLYGRADRRQLTAVLTDGGVVCEALEIELATIARIADLIHADGIVLDAVATLTTRGREVAA